MIRASGKRRGFTLIELLVVIGMIAVILGAFTTSVSSAQNRARIQKATNDVKIISQAILAYENFVADDNNGGGNSLPTMTDQPADRNTLGFLLGEQGTSTAGDRIPSLLMASLQGGGKMLDPWGHPYLVTIRKNTGRIKQAATASNLQTGYYLPNLYRLRKGERTLWSNQ